MYGFSDHLNAIPFTWFSALRQGSSRYSTPIRPIIEHLFEGSVRRLTLPLPTVPPPVADDLIEQGHAFAPFVSFARDPQLLREGDDVAGWAVVELPGHADGHVGYLRDGVLVAGDHLLNRITPAVGLYPESRPDPLRDYLASLRRTVELAPRIVLPGHGEPILDARGRATEILAHHAARLAETAAALGPEPRTGYEVSLALFGGELGPTQRRFAVAETLSHLERLVRQGRAARCGDGQVVTYTGP